MIEKPKAGDPTNELWKIVAQLVEAVNALQNITLSPQGIGKIIMSDGNIVIQLNTTDQCPS